MDGWINRKEIQLDGKEKRREKRREMIKERQGSKKKKLTAGNK